MSHARHANTKKPNRTPAQPSGKPSPPQPDGALQHDARPIAAALLRWYDQAKRDMPWRNTRDPYAIWVSETMLQQTLVATVIPYYHRFLARFPTVFALAAAELPEVLALWAGLGYYRRAKHLHAGAREVVARHSGRVPVTFEELLALPGIGRYTAGAIGSIAFGLPLPVVDGNVMRVLSRVYGYAADIAVPKNHAFFWEKAGAMVAEAPRHGGCAKSTPRFGDVNQAVMELGATVCTPASPACAECPLRAICVAYRDSRQAELPVKAAKKAVPVTRRTAIVILRTHAKRQEVLLMERPAGGLWEHMWEFPTVARGKDLAGLSTSLGLTLNHVQTCGTVRHQLTHRTMHYKVLTTQSRGELKGLLPACDDDRPYVTARWVGWPMEKDGKELAMAKVVEKIAMAACGKASPQTR